MARIGILEASQQANECPMHWTSRKLANAVVDDRRGRWITKKKVHLTSKEPWALIKVMFSETVTPRGLEIIVPLLRPFDPNEHDSMRIQYPIPDQTSYAKANFARVWGRNQECQQPTL